MSNETAARKLTDRSARPVTLAARWGSVALISLWLVAPAGADVYKWVDADGLVHYSDEPQAGSKRVTLPELSVVPYRAPVGPPAKPSVEGPSPTQPSASVPTDPMPPADAPPGNEPAETGSSSAAPNARETASASDASGASAGPADYELVAIRVPANNATVISPSGELNIELALQPDLRPTDSIQLFLDGQQVRDQLRSPRFSISGLELGSHILEARVVGPEGTLLRRSKSVLFHYQP